MEAISIAITAAIAGGVVGGWMVHAEKRRKASVREDAEWTQEEAEFTEINKTRRNLGREPITWEVWQHIRATALNNAAQVARDKAIYDPTRDGERWKSDAPIWQKLGNTESSSHSDNAR